MALKQEVRDRTEGRAVRIGTNGLPHYPELLGGAGRYRGCITLLSRASRHTIFRTHRTMGEGGGHGAGTQTGA